MSNKPQIIARIKNAVCFSFMYLYADIGVRKANITVGIKA